MPDIKPVGLLGGERIHSLSRDAKLHWPFLYAASNGHGRFKLDYATILVKAFAGFSPMPTENELAGWLQEYRDKHLLFVYDGEDGYAWGAWDSASGQRYFNAEDNRSPVPPEPDFTEWRARYVKRKKEQKKPVAASLSSLLLKPSGVPVQGAMAFGETFPQVRGNLDEKFPQSFVESDKSSTLTPTQHSTTQHTLNSAQVLDTTQSELNTARRGGENRETTGNAVWEDPEDMDVQSTAPSESWLLFRTNAASVGMTATGPEWVHLETVTWPRMGFAEQLAAIRGIDLRREGEYRDPAFVHGAYKYLTKQLWTKPPRPVPKPSGALTSAKDKANREFEERMLLMQSRKAIAQ